MSEDPLKQPNPARILDRMVERGSRDWNHHQKEANASEETLMNFLLMDCAIAAAEGVRPTEVVNCMLTAAVVIIGASDTKLDQISNFGRALQTQLPEMLQALGQGPGRSRFLEFLANATARKHRERKGTA